MNEPPDLTPSIPTRLRLLLEDPSICTDTYYMFGDGRIGPALTAPLCVLRHNVDEELHLQKTQSYTQACMLEGLILVESECAANLVPGILVHGHCIVVHLHSRTRGF